MLRFRNPGTQYSTQVTVIKELYKKLGNKEYFTLDDMAVVIAQSKMMTAYGYAGDDAIKLSNTPQESMNSALMNAKMYAEVFRMLGWVTPYGRKSYPLVFTYIGIHVALSEGDCSRLYEQCVLGINNPTELSDKMSYTEEVRVIVTALRSMVDLGGVIYDSTTSGVYIGTSGIGLGAGTFYVTSAGKLYASDAEISGTITATNGTIGGFTITPSSLTNSSGGSSIQIASGNYTTYLGANSCFSTYSSSDGARGWSLTHSAIQISSYTNSVYAGIKIQPNYTKRSSYTSATGTTIAEGCITTYSVASYNADQGYTIGSAVPFIIGIPRGYADAPYAPTFEWGSYLRFVNHTLSELVYDSYYGGTWRLRNAYNGKTYDLVRHKFYFWTYTSSVGNDSRVSITSTTHGLTSVSGAIVIPRENSTPGSSGSLSGDKNLINGVSNYGVYISGTTVYVICDTSSLSNGFYCLIYGS